MITIPCYKGHFEWNAATKGLEFCSDKEAGFDHTDKKRKSRMGFNVPVIQIPNFGKDRTPPNKSMRGILSSAGNQGVASKMVGQVTGARTSPRIGILRADHHSSVTLYDVKSVALSELEREKEENSGDVSLSFRALTKKSQFDSFLITLLRYFNCFLERLEQQKRPHKTSYLEPSKAEIKAMEETQKKLAVTKRHLGQAYCVLLLGIGLEKQHHMGCGKQRVSATHRDKKMYEDLYAFCTNFVFIAFRRKEYDRVRSEIGDMLRSPVYNPAVHPARRDTEESDTVTFHKPYVKDPKKPIGERVEKLLAVKLPKIEKMTPAEHRRQFGRRPAIMKAIHQRSTALVSLLPSPQESSEYLYMPTAADRQKFLKEKKNKECKTEFSSFQQDFYHFEKIGIIGEPMILFNAINLAPKNMDNEDEESSRGSDSPILRNSSSLHGGVAVLKQRTISRTTTEDSIPA